MNTLYSVGFLVLAMATLGQAQMEFPIFNRTCAGRLAAMGRAVKTSFNAAAFSGAWFEVMHYPQPLEPIADCMQSQYSWGFISRTFLIDRAGRDFVREQNFQSAFTAFISFPNESPLRAMLNVTTRLNGTADFTNYFIIATDYFQYAVGWGCDDLPSNMSQEFAWVASRTPELPQNYMARVNNLTATHFEPRLLRNVVQSEAYCLDRVLPGSASLPLAPHL